MQNKFGDMLKKLIQFTNIKLNVIAYHIGYDISYISKWANNTSQPTKKHIERINDTLSSIFAEEIIPDRVDMDLSSRIDFHDLLYERVQIRIRQTSCGD